MPLTDKTQNSHSDRLVFQGTKQLNNQVELSPFLRHEVELIL